MNKTIVFIFILCYSLLSSKEITMQTAKEIALKNNSEYNSQKYNYLSSTYSTKESWTSLLPQGSFNFNYLSNKDMPIKTNSKSYSAELNQPIFMQGKIWQTYKIKKDLQEIKKLTLEYQKFVTLNLTESKYFNFILAEKKLDISKTQLISSKKILKETEIKHKSGVISEVDLSNIRSDVSQKEYLLLFAETEYQSALNNFIGFLKLEEKVEPLAIDLKEYEHSIQKLQNIPNDKMDVLLDKVVDIGVERNLVLRIEKLLLDISNKELKISKLGNFPSLSASYSYSKNENFTGKYGDAIKTISLNFSLPIFPLTDKIYTYKNKYYLEKKAQEEFFAKQRDIKIELRLATLNLINSTKKIKAALQAKEFARKSYKKNKTRFDKQLLSSNELLSAELIYKQATLSLISSEHSFLIAKSQLMKMMNYEKEESLFNLFNI